MFHNVYVHVGLLASSFRTGAFPQRTMLVLSFYEASPSSRGAGPASMKGIGCDIEVHLKRRASTGPAGGSSVRDNAATAAMIRVRHRATLVTRRKPPTTGIHQF